jgi:hypothetical protein
MSLYVVLVNSHLAIIFRAFVVYRYVAFPAGVVVVSWRCSSGIGFL